MLYLTNLSRDTAEYGSLTSANKPWESVWTRTHNGLCYLLRMQGITADFVDDETLPVAPGRFATVIAERFIPSTDVTRKPSLAVIQD